MRNSYITKMRNYNGIYMKNTHTFSNILRSHSWTPHMLWAYDVVRTFSDIHRKFLLLDSLSYYLKCHSWCWGKRHQVLPSAVICMMQYSPSRQGVPTYPRVSKLLWDNSLFSNWVRDMFHSTLILSLVL